MTSHPGATPTIIRTIAELQAWSDDERKAGRRVAMVPTMGALHAGHLALVEEARAAADSVIVTIFVNPTQFAPGEDFDSYPRTEREDLAKLAPLGVDVVFAPNAAEMYPQGFATSIAVGGPSQELETAFRPHFFGGVAVVVLKLLTAGRPHMAIFGEKDYQQLLVIRQMARDLNLGIEIRGGATVREADGLALSSRNAYLDAGERRVAARLPATLIHVIAALNAGADAAVALADGRKALEDAGFHVDYLELRDAQTLGPADMTSQRPKRILAAARLGKTRLIDNMAV